MLSVRCCRCGLGYSVGGAGYSYWTSKLRFQQVRHQLRRRARGKSGPLTRSVPVPQRQHWWCVSGHTAM